MTTGKQKGYVLYDEVNDLLADDYPGGRELDDLLTELDTAGVEILEEPKLEFDKKAEDGEELADIEIGPDFAEKTNDPVRMYLREMGSVPLLTREGEIELAKRIERGQTAVRKALSRSPLVIREILAMPEEIHRDPASVRDILIMPELVVADEDVVLHVEELTATVMEIEKHYKKAQQFRQKLQAVSRSMKPKMHRSLRWGLARAMVQVSRLIRGIAFSSSTRKPCGASWTSCGQLSARSPKFSGSWNNRTVRRGRAVHCAKNYGSTASAFSNWKRNRARVPRNCGARCKSSSAAKWKLRTPRSN